MGLLYILCGAQPLSAAPLLHSDTAVANAGYYQLSWETAADRIELQEADDEQFVSARTRYLGSDRASVISGMPDGSRYYRVRALDGADAGVWSDTVQVSVAHHPLSRAMLFFAVGALVFTAILALILRGPGGSK